MPMNPRIAFAAAVLGLAPAAALAQGGGVFERLSGATPAADPCFARSYEPAHLARYPSQRVTQIFLKRERVEVRAENGTPRFTVRLGFRLKGGSDAYSTLALCTRAGATANCSGEGDTGAFRLELRGQTLRVAVERLEVEGATGSSPDLAASDDRLFVLQPAEAAACRDE